MSRLAIITGISNAAGIGRCLVKSFLDAGYLVGGIDIELLNEEAVLHSAITRKQFAFVQADITDECAVSAALSTILSELSQSHVDVLINNAAIANPHLSMDAAGSRLQQWRRTINVNLTGAFVLSELVTPLMKPSSSILHISSTRAHQSEAHCEAYAASKAGLVGLTHAQAVSLSSHGIRVNCVLPGWIDTGGYEVRDIDHMSHPAGRVGITQDISEICLFLCDSGRAGFITGQEFIVDGGMSKKMIYPEY